MKFDETEPDFNYPSLPKHVMYGVGWLVKKAGGSRTDIIVSARLISVLLGGLTVVLIYSIANGEREYLCAFAGGVFWRYPIQPWPIMPALRTMTCIFCSFITLSLYAIIKYRLFRSQAVAVPGIFLDRLCCLEQIYGGKFPCYFAGDLPDLELENHVRRLAADN
jgi:hypothetical protein